MIGFNKPYITGKENDYILDAINTSHISGNGKYTHICQNWFEKTYGFGKCLLTTSCTDALEMAAILLNIQPGDEIIIPSYTFVSTANAFALRGAKLVFVDSRNDHPGIDESSIESLITLKTKAIVPVHYAGVACDMDIIMEVANRYNIYVVEDAAQAINSYYIGKDGVKRPLGSIGHLAAFSFHETKNIISGEGGMLVVNDLEFKNRAEIIWEKGTNRSEFFKGKIDKYGWVDIGSSFLPSEIIAAFLWAQLENIEDIQLRRNQIWNEYNNSLKVWSKMFEISQPKIPNYATNNSHMYYLVFNNLAERTYFINELKKNKIDAVFHYQSLNKSSFYLKNNISRDLINSDKFTNCLVRLPFFYELQVDLVIDKIKKIIF